MHSKLSPNYQELKQMKVSMSPLGLTAILIGVAFWEAVTATAAAAAADELDIVRDGKAVATLVIPDEATHWERVAAGWVQEYVKKSSGANLSIVAESRAPEGTLISVGHTARAGKAGIGTENLKYDGCRMAAKGKVLYLIGRDVPGITPTATGYGAGARGTCRAATKFLEDIIGVRWLIPTSAGEWIPRKETISVPGDLNVAFSPAFAFAHGRYIYGDGPAGIANNIRTAILIKSFGDDSHSVWVPREKYAKDHPEYFMMTENGKRDPSGNHLCVSNPEVRELLKKGLFEQFEKGYELVQLGQTDGYRPCWCPKCKAMGDYPQGIKVYMKSKRSFENYLRIMRRYPCERLQLTHKWIIDEAAREYPDKKVHLLVYAPTRIPSRKFDYYGDNVMLEIAGNANPLLIDVWKGKAPAFSVYVLWFDITLGYGLDRGMSPAQVAERIRELHESGCIGIYLGGGGEGDWGFMGPTFYVLARMIGDPNLDYKTLVKEYCDGMYGKASAEMQNFFDVLFTRLFLKRVPGATLQDMQLIRYPPQFLANLEDLIETAEATAESERVRNLIRMTRDQFEFNKYTALALLSYRNWKAYPTAANWQQLKESVETYDAFRERAVRYDDAFVRKYFPGYDNFCNYLTGRDYYSSWSAQRAEVLSKPIKETDAGYTMAFNYPMTLDFDKKPPKLGEMKVRRATTAPELDGRLDDAVWTRAQVHDLPILATQEDVPTAVRVLYDDKNLYFGFECEEPLIDKLVANATGRDGPVHRMDCGEIMLGPDRSRRRFYHWIIAPADDAIYDDRTGFKHQDDQDPTWNGTCEYAYFVDKPNERWFLEVRIPFATMEVQAPRTGSWWLANFGRERRAGGLRSFFLWSQDESAGFNDPAAFGKIHFVD